MKSINEIINESEVKKSSEYSEIKRAAIDFLQRWSVHEQDVQKHDKNPEEMTYSFAEHSRNTYIQISTRGEYSDEILLIITELDVSFPETEDPAIYFIAAYDHEKDKNFKWCGMSAKDIKDDLEEAFRTLIKF